MRVLLTKARRALLLAAVSLLPEHERIARERHLRGREESGLLARADVVVVSFGKSGRTWLRVMLSRFFQIRFNLPEHVLIGFDNMHRRNRWIPRILFTHDNYLKDYTGHGDSKQDYSGRRVVLLVRDPADVAVSQFFQWKFRMKAHKKRLNNYPPPGSDLGLFDFVMGAQAGLPKIIAFMNLWARAAREMKDLLIVRYEDMRAQPEQMLGQIVDFMGFSVEEAQIREAVEFARFENMRGLERKGRFFLAGSRMRPGERDNPDSYKVRRAKVGGYRDYFSDDQTEAIDRLIEATLAEQFGYNERAGGGRIPAAVTA